MARDPKQIVFMYGVAQSVNDLLYGYGGAKLFPKKVLEAEDWSVDMTTTIGCPICENSW